MKPLLTLCLLVMILFTKAQTQLPNTHWINPNSISSPSFHLFFEGYSNGQYHYAIENKQPCTVKMSIRGLPDFNIEDTIISIQSDKTKHLLLSAQYNLMDTIWCKALDSCSITYDTCYWGITLPHILPVVFKSVPQSIIKGDSVEVRFNIEDISPGSVIRIKYATRTKNWEIKRVVIPTDIKQTYYIIKFKR